MDNKIVIKWVLASIIDEQSFAQIARDSNTYPNKVRREIAKYQKRVREKNDFKPPKGKPKRLPRTANAGLSRSYFQCSRCGKKRIKFIYDGGVKIGYDCKRCGFNSFEPSAAKIEKR